MKKITRLPVRADQVQHFGGRGPYSTKSKAVLNVPLTLATYPLANALSDLEKEIAPLSRRLVRQRVYTVRAPRRGVSADAQVNKRSTKIITVLNGNLWISYTDFGCSRPEAAKLFPMDSILIPPGITHATRVDDPSTLLLVVENTAHNPNSSQPFPVLFEASVRRTSPHTIAEVQHLQAIDALVGETGARLQPLVTLNPTQLEQFLTYDQEPVLKIGRAPGYHIPGEQVYATNGIKQLETGGMHAHGTRQQITFCTRGSVLWTMEDAYRNERGFVLNEGDGVWVPNDILHSYKGVALDSDLLTIASTLYRPDDSDSHDECDIETFVRWQEKFSAHE